MSHDMSTCHMTSVYNKFATGGFHPNYTLYPLLIINSSLYGSNGERLCGHLELN